MFDYYMSDFDSIYFNLRGVKYFKLNIISFVLSLDWISWFYSFLFLFLNSMDFSLSSRFVVYIDGCCLKNGRNGVRVGIGVYWGFENIRYMFVCICLVIACIFFNVCGIMFY